MNTDTKPRKNKSDAIWVVDDDSSIRWVLSKALEQAGRTVRSFETGDAASAQLEFVQPDVIVTDIRMPGMDGLSLLGQLQERAPDVPVIVMTAHTDLDAAVSSFKGGAFEYLPKPFDIDEAVKLIARASRQRPGAGAPQGDSPQIPTSATRLIGEAPAMQDVFRAIGRLSGSDLNVLLCGESGTGKELVAHALYENSPRADRPFEAINMAAIPADLLEAELFGYEAGAVPGANAVRAGRFEQANGGTLFLDEIGDMPAQLQTRLLRVLSDGKINRIGGHDAMTVDVRIVAASNKNLEDLVARGDFREDLFHRLNVIRVSLPALRERCEDIPDLVGSFLERCAVELNVEPKSIDVEAMAYLKDHEWPGNVRQLENVCRWVTVMAPAQSVGLRDLPDELSVSDEIEMPVSSDWVRSLSAVVEKRLQNGETRILDSLAPEFEKLLIEVALKHTGGHKQEAARRLGWGRNTLTRKLKELGIQGARPQA